MVIWVTLNNPMAGRHKSPFTSNLLNMWNTKLKNMKRKQKEYAIHICKSFYSVTDHHHQQHQWYRLGAILAF